MVALNKQDLLDAENRRYKAMIDGDLNALDKILSDDLTYIHSDAVVDTKAQYISNLASGNLQYISITSQEEQTRFYTTCGIVTGIARLHIKLQGKDKRFRMRYTSVYTQDEDAWQMVALQSTGMPDA